MMAKESKMMRLRTVSAMEAVKRYPCYDKYDVQSSIVDLLADLLHLANKRNYNTSEILVRATQHFDAERKEKI